MFGCVIPRALRVEYEGATYHVMCRGNRGARIFETPKDTDLWLKTLAESCERSQLVVHAYCLMRTHYHLLLETPKGNLVEGMKWLQATFTQRYNALHRQWGHLFQGRYKAKVVDSDPAYFRTAGLYILLNPVDAGLIDLRQKNLETYPWTAYASYLKPPTKRPQWLQTERLMSSFGIGSDSASGRRAFAAYVKERGLSLQLRKLDSSEQREWKSMERGWVHGCAAFREAMINLLKEQSKAKQSIPGDQRRDIGESEAKSDLHQGMKALGLVPGKLDTLRKGDEYKLLLAGWIRRHFPVSAKWCADQLAMGHITSITKAWHFYEKPSKKWKKQKIALDQILKT